MTETLVMSTPHTHPRDTPPAPTLGRRLLLDTGYALSTLPFAVAAFASCVVMFSAGLGLAVVVGGVLLLSLGVQVVRGFAQFERVRQRHLLGKHAPTPAYLCAPRDAGFWRRALTPLRDPQSWLDVVWALVGFVTGVASFVIAVVWWALTLGGLTYWFWQRYIPFDDADNVTLAEILGLGHGRTPESLLNLAIGVVALLTLPFALRFAAVLHSSVASVLLCSRAELQSQVARVEDSRDAARLAEADALRRLERDIHDGPQQRLVRLTMDLGRARKQVEDDPVRAAATIESALSQARETVDELRSLSRGIAPPLLVDRGLRVALEEMVRGSAVPVEHEIAVPDHLAPHVETAVYFVVAEALTNVAKHSGATRVWVRVAAGPEAVTVHVEDDGLGGAHESKGLGLAGLRQRLAGVDGVLHVESPAGGPTVVRARIPIEGGR